MGTTRPDGKFAWLLQQSGCSVAEMSLLQTFAIACHHKDTTVDGRVFPPFHVWLSSAEIARRSGLNERTIPAVIARLKQRGLIESAGRYGKTGQIKVYRLLIDANETPQECAPFALGKTPQVPAPFGATETPQVPASKDRRFLHESPKDSASTYIEGNRDLNQIDNARDARTDQTRLLKTSFKDWYETTKAANPKVFADDDPIFTYLAAIGMSYDFMLLHWHVFKERQLAGERLHADWPRVFQASVKANDWRLWYRDASGTWRLTTAGKQAALEHECDPDMTSGAPR